MDNPGVDMMFQQAAAGTVPVEAAQEPVRLTVEQRNELFDKHLPTVSSKPSFKAGDIVELNDLGASLNLGFMAPGQKAYVKHWGQAITKMTGDDARDVEIQLFNDRGELIRVATDSRFLKKTIK
jgi:hypothetical protein